MSGCPPRNNSSPEGDLREQEVIHFFQNVLNNVNKRRQHLSNSCEKLEGDMVTSGQRNTQQFMSIVEYTESTSCFTENMLSHISRLCGDLEAARNVSEQTENERNQMFKNCRCEIKRRLESDVYKDEYTMKPYYEVEAHTNQLRTSVKEIMANISNLKKSSRSSFGDIVNERNTFVALNEELAELGKESNSKIEQIKIKIFTNEFKQNAVVKHSTFPFFNM